MIQTQTYWIEVKEIKDQGDRVLITQHPEWHYYIICTPQQASDIKIGDKVEYEPYGYNFGWFLKKREDEKIQENKQGD